MTDPGPSEHSAAVDVPVHHLVRDRWSPRSFRHDPVDGEDLARLFEAARWAPSNGNAQPWRYLLTYRGEPAHQRLVATLNEGNRRWAPNAPVLVASYAQTVFAAKGDRPARVNPTALHDLGLANATLALQATALGLCVHFMAGFDAPAGFARWHPECVAAEKSRSRSTHGTRVRVRSDARETRLESTRRLADHVFVDVPRRVRSGPRERHCAGRRCGRHHAATSSVVASTSSMRQDQAVRTPTCYWLVNCFVSGHDEGIEGFRRS